MRRKAIQSLFGIMVMSRGMRPYFIRQELSAAGGGRATVPRFFLAMAITVHATLRKQRVLTEQCLTSHVGIEKWS
jgi:hypothetical protein